MKRYLQPHLVIFSHSNFGNPLELINSCPDFKQFQLNNKNTINYNQNENELPIEKVRKLINESYSLNNQKELKFLLIFYLDQASNSAQNALLKLTEEPPYNLKIIYLIKDENKILDTIKSRCLLTRIKHADNFDFIEKYLPQLNIKINENKIDQINLDDYLEIETFLKKTKKTLPELSDQKKAEIILEEIIKKIYTINKQNENKKIYSYEVLKKINQTYNLVKKNLNAKLVLFKLFFCLENKLPLLFQKKM